MPISGNNLLALDVGEVRVGVAFASSDSLIASPLITLNNDTNLFNNLSSLINEKIVNLLVIGLPRNLDGEDTKQTTEVKKLADKIKNELNIEIKFQDEALTSVKAKEEYRLRGKMYSKSDVDKLAACYILEDFIKDNY
jgi:putative Holliday junction resolvase